MPAGSLGPMRPDPYVGGPVPSSSRIDRCAPPRSTPAFGSDHLDAQISRPALQWHLFEVRVQFPRFLGVVVPPFRPAEVAPSRKAAVASFQAIVPRPSTHRLPPPIRPEV